MLVQQLSSSGQHNDASTQASTKSIRYCLWLILTSAIYSFSVFSQQLALAFIIPIFPQVFWDKIISQVGIPRGILKNCSTGWTFGVLRQMSSEELKRFSCVSVDAFSPEWTLVINGTYIQLYDHVALRVGVLGAAPAVTYLFLVPIVRPLIRKIGVCSVTLIGSFLVFFSLIPPTIELKFVSFVVSRLIHGVGFMLVVVGMTTRVTAIAQLEDGSRHWLPTLVSVMGSFGSAIGPVFGGSLYQVIDLRFVYGVVAAIVVVDILGQISLFDSDPCPIIFHNTERMSSILKDPYALIGFVSLGLLASIIALITVFVPLWLIEMLNLPSWQLGFVIFPTVVSQVIGNVLSSLIGNYFSHWVIGLIGFILNSLAIFLLPLAHRLYQVLMVMTFIGFADGIATAAVIPMLTTVIDRRHDGAYVVFYDLTERVRQIGAIIGPMLGVALLYLLTFPWVLRVFSILLFAWAFFQIALRNPPSKVRAGQVDESSKSE